uniref:Uncharacterized protein n=1 Tax=Panagrolaimus sp. JU765 TaxID=591449 RepID=A0AC34QGP1_9BILA
MTPLALLWLVCALCAISFAVPTRTYSVATGNGNLFRPGFHDSFDGFVKRSIPVQQPFAPSDVVDMENFVKRSVALGRTNFRPSKRSMVMGRIGFRPGKRSVVLDEFPTVGASENRFQTPEFQTDSRIDQFFFPAESAPKKGYFERFGNPI